jgi:hypothetical protein
LTYPQQYFLLEVEEIIPYRFDDDPKKLLAFKKCYWNFLSSRKHKKLKYFAWSVMPEMIPFLAPDEFQWAQELGGRHLIPLLTDNGFLSSLDVEDIDTNPVLLFLRLLDNGMFRVGKQPANVRNYLLEGLGDESWYYEAWTRAPFLIDRRVLRRADVRLHKVGFFNLLGEKDLKLRLRAWIELLPSLIESRIIDKSELNTKKLKRKLREALESEASKQLGDDSYDYSTYMDLWAELDEKGPLETEEWKSKMRKRMQDILEGARKHRYIRVEPLVKIGLISHEEAVQWSRRYP